jgi:hypothetical protein
VIFGWIACRGAGCERVVVFGERRRVEMFESS